MEENARLKRQQEQVNNHEMDPPFLGVPLLSFEHFGVLHHKVAGRFLLVYLTLMPIFFLSFFFGQLTSATAAQLPKKNTLHRTSTAPF